MPEILFWFCVVLITAICSHLAHQHCLRSVGREIAEKESADFVKMIGA